MFEFRSLTFDNIITAVRALPDKQSASDPFLTHLLKDNVGILASAITCRAVQPLSLNGLGSDIIQSGLH